MLDPGRAIRVRALVLAAGRSRRMGKDKAALVIEGEPVLARIDRIAGELGLVPTYSLRAEQLDLLPAGREAIHDRWADVGPLGGIATALHHFRGEGVLAIPVDMPRLDAEHLGLLLDADGSAAACLGAGSHASPLPSLWMPECREAVVEHVESGRLSVRAALDRVGFEVFDVAPEVLRNVNDPENFRERSRQSMS